MKFLPDAVVDELIQKLSIENGDIVFFGADKSNIVNDSLGALRVKIGEDFGFIEE